MNKKFKKKSNNSNQIEKEVDQELVQEKNFVIDDIVSNIVNEQIRINNNN